MEQANFVYILQCRDGSLYTGWTCNLEKRVAVHSAGMGAKYTRSRLPVDVYKRQVLSVQKRHMI